jgi:hypothetical protein
MTVTVKSKSEISAELVLFRAARDAILGGAQSYSINGRSLERGDLKTILDEIKSLEIQLARYGKSGLIKSPVFGA